MRDFVQGFDDALLAGVGEGLIASLSNRRLGALQEGELLHRRHSRPIVTNCRLDGGESEESPKEVKRSQTRGKQERRDHWVHGQLDKRYEPRPGESRKGGSGQ